nr:MAG TPA: hypothetical protein [Caudoviricetes sp.]
MPALSKPPFTSCRYENVINKIAQSFNMTTCILPFGVSCC